VVADYNYKTGQNPASAIETPKQILLLAESTERITEQENL